VGLPQYSSLNDPNVIFDNDFHGFSASSQTKRVSAHFSLHAAGIDA